MNLLAQPGVSRHRVSPSLWVQWGPEILFSASSPTLLSIYWLSISSPFNCADTQWELYGQLLTGSLSVRWSLPHGTACTLPSPPGHQ